MKIAVCFKIVPDYEEAAPSTWENIDVMDFTYVKKIYGCFDEAALETGLKLKDSLQAAGRSVETLAVTVGGGPEVLLQGLFAAGFDRVVTIAQEAGKPPETGERQEDGDVQEAESPAPLSGGPDFRPRDTARILADFLRRENPDVILTGKMTGPGDSGMVPFHLASEMKCPLLTEVTKAEYDPQGGRIRFSRQTEDRMLDQAVRGMAVCAVGDAETPYLRMFSLKARMEARSRKPEDWKSGVQHSPCHVLLHSEVRQGKCSMIDGETPEQKAEVLWRRLNGEDGECRKEECGSM